MNTDHDCPECGKRRINTPSGSVCPDGHGKLCPAVPDADSLFDDFWDDDEDDDDDFWDDDEDHGGDCDCEECTADRHFDDCGRLPPHLGGGCQLAGSEHCDFECPFRDSPPWGDDEDEDEDES